MKMKLWREKSVGEREQALRENIEKLRTLRFDIATRTNKKHRSYRELKRDVARLKTLETETSVQLATE